MAAEGVNRNNGGKFLPNDTIDGKEHSGERDGYGNSLTRGYINYVGHYGVYADPYLDGVDDPEQFTATENQNKIYLTSQNAVAAK